MWVARRFSRGLLATFVYANTEYMRIIIIRIGRCEGNNSLSQVTDDYSYFCL